jgi:hypothetical protein
MTPDELTTVATNPKMAVRWLGTGLVRLLG